MIDLAIHAIFRSFTVSGLNPARFHTIVAATVHEKVRVLVQALRYELKHLINDGVSAARSTRPYSAAGHHRSDKGIDRIGIHDCRPGGAHMDAAEVAMGLGYVEPAIPVRYLIANVALRVRSYLDLTYGIQRMKYPQFAEHEKGSPASILGSPKIN